MADEKTHVEVEEIKITKSFDDAFKGSMPKVMQAAIKKAVDKSKSLTTGKGADGLLVGGTVSALTKDTKGNKTVVSAKVSLFLANSKKSIFGSASGESSTEAEDPDKPTEDVKYLLQEMCRSLMEDKVVPALEKKAAEK